MKPGLSKDIYMNDIMFFYNHGNNYESGMSTGPRVTILRNHCKEEETQEFSTG